MLKEDWPLDTSGELELCDLWAHFYNHSVFTVYSPWATPISAYSGNGGENKFLCGFRETELRMEPLRA